MFLLGNNFQLHFWLSFGNFLHYCFQLLPASHPEKLNCSNVFGKWIYELLCVLLFETDWIQLAGNRRLCIFHVLLELNYGNFDWQTFADFSIFLLWAHKIHWISSLCLRRTYSVRSVTILKLSSISTQRRQLCYLEPSIATSFTVLIQFDPFPLLTLFLPTLFFIIRHFFCYMLRIPTLLHIMLFTSKTSNKQKMG